MHAQTPAQRDSVEAFRDSLTPISDTVTLRALEAHFIEIAKQDRNDPMRHLRLGFIAMRLGQAGRKDSYEDAAGEFEWATQVAPKEPYGWYGLGLAENAIGDASFTLLAGIQAMFGRDHLTRAAVDYAKAAEVDPSFVRGLLELGNTALEQRMNVKLDAALLAFRRAAATSGGHNTQVLLVRGRVERLVGDPDSALMAFREYTKADGADTALGLLEEGRTLFLLGSLDGERPYYEAAATDDSAAVSGIRRDIVPLVGDTALAGLDSVHGKERANWLRRFWGVRDVADLRSPGERVREHYRRLFYARNHFRLVSTKRRYSIEERYRSYDHDYDDRGLIYIRHGEPTDRASAHTVGLPLNESWRYQRPDGDLLFHFVAREDVQDYRLVGSLFDILGFDTAMALAGGAVPASQPLSVADIIAGNASVLPSGVRGVAQDLLVTRRDLSPIYGRLLSSNLDSRSLLAAERQLGETSIQRGTTSDSYTLQFDGDLPDTRWSLLVAGREGDREVAHLVYAIPGKSLHPISATAGEVYPVRVRVAVIGPDSTTVARVDSTSMFLTHRVLGDGDWLIGRVAMELPPGRYRYRVALQNGDVNGLDTPIDTIGVPGPGAFGVSDIVLGARSAHLYWPDAATGDTVFFNPVGAIRPDVSLEVYYQVFGLASGERFQTQFRVLKPGGGGFLHGLFHLFGGGAPVSVGFEAVASGPVAEVHRSISIDRLTPGAYEFELAITRADGTVLRRRAPFRVLAPEKPVRSASP
ncbi:MAG: hypothetical protein WBC97_01160 [Gemmatimonadales bacterium]